MIPCRVIFNELPEDILQQVLRVDEIQRGDPRWRLLRSGNTRRTYRFAPQPDAPAWLVKWGCRYTSWKKLGGALLGRDQATVEWQKTRTAEQCGLPVVSVCFIAGPRPLSGRFHSLLVERYLENSQNFIEFLSRPDIEPARIEEALTRLGSIVADIHAQGLLHRDLSLDNILILDSDPKQILVIDWFKMWPLEAGDRKAMESDLVAPLCDMVYCGLDERFMRQFILGYCEKAEWMKDRIESVLAKGFEVRRGMMWRAWRNCNWRNRGVERFRHKGYRVFSFKNQEPDDLKKRIESSDSPTEIHPRWGKQEDSSLLTGWRKANLLRASGLVESRIAAYAIRSGAFQVKEVLLHDNNRGGETFADAMASQDWPSRRKLLHQAGQVVQRMHRLGVGLERVELQKWFIEKDENGALQFSTSDLDAITLHKEGELDDEQRFNWLKDEKLKSFGLKSLMAFLRGYDGEMGYKETIQNRFNLLSSS